ncbi:MAG: FAD-dependent oxidoreductase [Myxococcota bacterium]|nr:FAD-dependent oxidoreductase [Myxococcota bacterium]
MSEPLPAHARVVIIGGGIIGCSVAYHLAQLGWRDVLLLERKSLTCGTTWHAAGLVAQLRATHNLTRLAQYSAELYARLEAETGQATGFLMTGSLSIARDRERLEELLRGASMARCFGVEIEPLGPDEIKRIWPALDPHDLVGGVYVPGDASTSPVDTTLALARGARAGGARIRENTKVTGIQQKDGRVTGVVSDAGEVSADYVVNCGGIWANEIAGLAGVSVPLHAAEHFYVITEPVPGLEARVPTLRDPGGCTYYKWEAGGKLLIGFFEPHAKPWGMDGIPESFAFDQLPEDWEHLEPQLEETLRRVPALRETGIRTFLNGPESFTPDDRYYLGESPALRNFFVAAGFNSIGIQSAGGAGMALAHWIVEGQPPMDLWDVDLRRALPFQSNPDYLRERTTETLGLLYAMHWPYRQFETARGMRLSPLHDRLAARGACFGELAGWERPNWFAPPGVEARYAYSYGRQNWFEHSAAEHRGVRERVGLFDQSSFAKFRLEGPDAEAALGWVSANDVAVPVGRVVYTQWLNERGGIEADLTVTRLGANSFLIVTSPPSQVRDLDWLRRQLPTGARAEATDLTEQLSVLGLMGPRSRELLAVLTDADLSSTVFPFGSSREIELAGVRVRATRITYVGELGFELYVDSADAPALYDAIVARGDDFGLVHAGYHALNSLRIEKGYRHWGHDICTDDTPLEAGLGFAVSFDKPGGFLGREALLAQRRRPPARRLVQFALEDPEPLLYHDEPIWRDGELVGHTTSGMFGHTLGRSVALGYLNSPQGVSADWVRAGSYEIEVACERFPAKPSLRPLYDPRGERIRA